MTVRADVSTSEVIESNYILDSSKLLKLLTLKVMNF